MIIIDLLPLIRYKLALNGSIYLKPIYLNHLIVIDYNH